MAVGAESLEILQNVVLMVAVPVMNIELPAMHGDKPAPLASITHMSAVWATASVLVLVGAYPTAPTGTRLADPHGTAVSTDGGSSF